MDNIKLETSREITSTPFFSKLEQKTQMIKNKKRVDNFHNRSTHTMEVMNCALLIKDQIKEKVHIDEEILVASSLLHDIGHTPFGHAGEEILNEIFLSNDNLHYAETYPGLFKHNINSIKIIGEHFDEKYKKFEIMDAILKHTSPFPKNYCFNVFKEANIIKSNFILRYFEPSLTENLKKFINLFTNLDLCKFKSLNHIVDFNYCHLCLNAENKNCKLCVNTNLNEFLLSKYICYPYALTYEGAILYLADEISCFCSDLVDFSNYVMKNEKEISLFIPFAKINNAVSIIKTLYPNNEVTLLLQQYIDLFSNGKSLDNGTVTSIADKIKEEMVKTVKTTQKAINIDNIYISFDQKDSFCQPLLTIDESCLKILEIIKNAIYQDLHSIPRIKNNNKTGQKKITKLINYYCDHLTVFFDEYRNTYKDSLFKRLSMSIARVIKKDYKEVFKHIVNNKLDKIDEVFGEEFKNRLKIDDKNLLLAKNLVKREIGYFVATLSDEECDLFVKNYFHATIIL